MCEHIILLAKSPFHGGFKVEPKIVRAKLVFENVSATKAFCSFQIGKKIETCKYVKAHKRDKLAPFQLFRYSFFCLL